MVFANALKENAVVRDLTFKSLEEFTKLWSDNVTFDEQTILL